MILIRSFLSSSPVIGQNSPLMLSWDVEGATAISLSSDADGAIPITVPTLPNGSQQVTAKLGSVLTSSGYPRGWLTTYSLTATNATETAVAKVQVLVFDNNLGGAYMRWSPALVEKFNGVFAIKCPISVNGKKFRRLQTYPVAFFRPRGRGALRSDARD
jgi:hypothetical protein